jgi:hypothetical protein
MGPWNYEEATLFIFYPVLLKCKMKNEAKYLNISLLNLIQANSASPG